MINWLRVPINDSTHQPLSPRYDDNDKMLGLKLFRGPLITIFYLFLLSINISVWIKFNIKFVKIFKLKAEHANKYLNRIRAIVIFLTIFLVTSLLLFYLSPYFIKVSIPRYSIQFILHGILATCFLLCCLLDPDFWLLRIILKTILAPTFSVSFPEVWLADQANSLVQVFLDLQFTVCLYSSPTDITRDWDSVVTTSDCKPASILWVTLIKCLPAWWRLAQCLR